MDENAGKFNVLIFHFSLKIAAQRSLNEVFNALLQKTALHITAKGT